MSTPWGPRRYNRDAPLRIGRTRGHKALSKATTVIQRKSPERLQVEIHKLLGEALRG